MVLLPTAHMDSLFSPRCVWVNGPIIVGAGPSGLAVAASLREQGVPFVVLEREDCIASLWQKRTYNRLKLHLPKQFCQLPRMPFPESYPEYPTRLQFIDYLEEYAAKFDIKPEFRSNVQSAHYDETSGLWRVRVATADGSEMEYIGRWLVVATGENAENVVPDIPGLADFGGEVTHISEYKPGKDYSGKRVLVVGCGNSGMEISLDLCEHAAQPSMVVRGAVHVLPREGLGKSTFELATLLMAWLRLWFVDYIVIFLSWLILGILARFGIRSPAVGPLTLKNTHGRTPVFNTGALAKIRSGDITVVPGVTRFTKTSAELTDGTALDLDAVVMAPRCVSVTGPIIVGAGPSGLAVAASLRDREQGVPFVVLEREDCIASLHLPKQFCQLPRMPFPESYPEYPTRLQFIDYLEKYAAKFDIKPEFRRTVQSARYDEKSGLWRVRVAAADGAEMEYMGHYVVRPKLTW